MRLGLWVSADARCSMRRRERRAEPSTLCWDCWKRREFQERGHERAAAVAGSAVSFVWGGGTGEASDVSPGMAEAEPVTGSCDQCGERVGGRSGQDALCGDAGG